MSNIKTIAEKYEIETEDGFRKAMKEMQSIPEIDIRFKLSYETGGQSRNFKREHTLAKAELDRRNLKEQRKLTYVSGFFGIAGVIAGAFLQFYLQS
ncbi:hypothetical protein [Stappia sp.]|uniref:hypothetical protein n=1 Tax=Stappia sp. TaxID=1870903 RepID=UPI003C7AEC9E